MSLPKLRVTGWPFSCCAHVYRVNSGIDQEFCDISPRFLLTFFTFFYRCKRQYQMIDTRKLGFAELKSLAELANEMVESKRDIEARLASVEAELATKKAS